MNKTELVSHVASQCGLTKAAADQAVNAVFDSITQELSSGGSLTLVGFGTFSIKKREARTGRNPQTGATIQIAAANVPSFKPGATLKSAVQ